ncbi:MAG TPA: asparaginase [Paenalcaligenes sp.]|nr:asparaginase [Paenalcaligenes sp.]
MGQRQTIALVTTGGTIAATHQATQSVADYSVTHGAEQLVAAVPTLADLANIESYPLYQLDSRNMNQTIQRDLVLHLLHILAKPHIHAVVLCHGTDTMEETAMWLHSCIAPTKPVVLVGAMRPASALSADGPLNLHQAFQVALAPEARHRGVMLVANDEIHLASRLRKLHQNATTAFHSNASGPIGTLGADGVHFHGAAPAPNGSALIDINGLSASLPAIDIMFDHPDANLALYEASIKSGRAGVVIAALGNGSLSPTARAGATLLHQHGIACVRSSRIPLGSTTASEQDLDYHSVHGAHFSAQQCRILLMLGLASGHLTRDALQALFHAAWRYPR